MICRVLGRRALTFTFLSRLALPKMIFPVGDISALVACPIAIAQKENN